LDKLEEYGTGWGLREEDASDITRELTA